MDLIRNFKNLTKTDPAIAGGKGASLGEMTRIGIPVPPGFVILSDAFEKFLEETDLNVEIDAILHTVNHKEMHTVEHASEKIQALILDAEMPKDIATEVKKQFKVLNTKYVAVRSSATAEDSASAAWAGQLDSFLNTTEKDLLEKVKRCWASLFTPRAIFYRFEKELHKQKISVAVVIQKMVESEISGIAFSVHPVTQDRNQLIIEAGFGLGEAIVSGQITPDSYVVEKQPRSIIDRNVATQERGIYRAKNGGNEWRDIVRAQGEQQALTDEQILELSQLILKIEHHYGFPCDIEWAYEKGTFYIVQSRPITTLSSEKTEQVSQPHMESYKRLFQFNGFVPFILSYQFVDSYHHLGGLAFSHKKEWLSYMLNSKIQKTLKDGFELYKNKKTYENYKKDLYDLFHLIENTYVKYKKLKNISKKDFLSFLPLFAKYQQLYLKTEFFYTDLAFEKRKEFPLIEENLKSFELFKIDGRSYLNTIFFVQDSIFGGFLKKTARQFNVSDSHIWSYSFEEIVELFNSHKKVSESVIVERQEAHVLYATEEGKGFFAGKQAKKFIEDATEHKYSAVIMGTIANKGKVTARAKVIKVGLSDYGNLSKVIDAMEQGQVLVAETTEPSIIAACKKASAIVTNQGGMMSHAAIVSREMNIPCIVGTNIATDVIGDGDLIEVDANNGVVRILDQSKSTATSLDKPTTPEHQFKFMWGQKQSAMISEGMMWQLMRTLGLKGEFVLSHIPETLFIMKDGIFEHFMPTHSYAHIAKDGAKYLQKNFSKMLSQIIDQHVKDFFNFAEKVRLRNLSGVSNGALYKILETYETFFNKTFVFFGTSSNWWTDTLTNTMEDILSKNITDPVRKEEYFINLCTPTEIDETIKERLEFLDLVQNRQTSPRHLEKYARRFPALFFNTYDNDEVQRFLASRVKEEQAKDFLEERKRITHNLSVMKERQKKIYKEIQDPLLKYCAKTLQRSALNRYRLKHVWSGGEYLFLNFFKELQKRLGVPFNDFIKTYTFTDMKNFLKKGKMLDAKEIKDRKICFVMHDKNGIIHLISGKKALAYIDQLLPKVQETKEINSVIKGQIANKGLVKGRARVVFVKDLEQFLHDNKKFQKGEILVTTMTSPVMIPLIEKAAAIVTDEGGICSHAAISAREFNIPCIIGTHGASSRIRTGDFVEVDAERGIIRILSKTARGLEDGRGTKSGNNKNH